MKTFFLYLIIALFSLNAFAQSNPLDRRVSIKLNKQSVEKALWAIGRAGGVGFSYNSDQMPLDSLVTIDYKQKEIAKVLDGLLSKKYNYKTAGQHIILMRKKEVIYKTATEKQFVNIKGYVFEWGTGKPLPNTSVCNVTGKEGVLTDRDGTFNIELKQKGRFIQLSINKQNYQDTIVFLNPKEKKEIEIRLVQRAKELDLVLPQLTSLNTSVKMEQNKWVNRLVDPKMVIHAQNIDYFTQRPAQISFLPYAGSNHKLSGSIVNKISVNVLAGYSYGVAGLEVGGMMNINRHDVEGVQLAGFGNITGRNLKGVAAAGFFNHCLGNVHGVQIAGFYNSVQDSIAGVQLAGFTNVLNGKIKGTQIAGFANITTKEVEATQISGFANMAMKKSKGVQIAGFGNWTKADQTGVQVGGFANCTNGNLDGVQISGFANICNGSMDGLQLAGFLNYAHHVRGLQIGIVNFADSVSGVSLGLLNFVKKGIHQLVLHTDEMGNINLSLMFGSYHLYSIMGVCTLPFQSNANLGITLGIGSRFFPQKRISMDLKLTSTSFTTGKQTQNDNNKKYSISSELNLKLSKRTAIFFGPSFNLFSYANEQADLSTFPKIVLFPNPKESVGDTQNLKCWMGASLGFVFEL